MRSSASLRFLSNFLDRTRSQASVLSGLPPFVLPRASVSLPTSDSFTPLILQSLETPAGFMGSACLNVIYRTLSHCQRPAHHYASVLQSLETLAGVTGLACLNVIDCSVTDDGVAALQKALPRLAVSHTRAPEGYWEISFSDSDVRTFLAFI